MEGAALANTEPSPPSSRPSSSIHGRFDPGTRLGSRYRVVGLLGRGGMGEVYRADDLELNQSVALKFLPEKVARNAGDLARLRQEVRIARQIAHPNVCRTYDISEADGQVFVVMEYVDGEDLASVLRRLGRPTPDKALEIARQLCLGIGAAHENGVLHRDLKPANIMIDGRGRVRITDFGLAGTVEEIAAEGGASGTPGYMAPEQLSSGKASIQSDIFALGLVLYELFTGKRAADVTPRPDPSRPDSDSQLRTPSSLVGDVDPVVERVILRCLERDPARRPQSAYAVYGALPGGDPLAAAVAAGETPSPELVANAGVEGSVRPLYAGLAVLFVILTLLVASVVQRPLFAGLGRSPEVLAVRAEEVMTQATGKAPPHFSSLGLRYEPVDAAKGGDSTSAGVSPQMKKAGAIQFWRRWSLVPLEGTDIHIAGSDLDNPPQSYPGSGRVVLDPAGRLLALSIVRDRSLDSMAASPPDWDAILRFAGRIPSHVMPTTVPAHLFAGADTVAAWAVSDSGAPDTTIVAGAVRGKIVDMDTIAGGKRLGDLELRVVDTGPPPGLQGWVFTIFITVIPFLGSIFLARRNIRSGRVDMRGALVAGVASAILQLAYYLFTVNQHELGFRRVLTSVTGETAMAHALLHGVAMFFGYLAIEPYVRRLWPNSLVSWARLVSGRVRDPIVGRDLLAGLVLGSLFVLAYFLFPYLAAAFGVADKPFTLAPVALNMMLGSNSMLATLAIGAAAGLLRATVFFTLFVFLRFLLRNNWAPSVVLSLLFALMFLDYSSRSVWLEFGVVFAVNTVALLTILRYGFLAAIVTLASALLLEVAPWTTDFGTWVAPQTVLAWLLVLGALGYGFVIAVGGKSLLHDPLSDPVAAGVRAKK